MKLSPDDVQKMHSNLASFNTLYVLVRLMKHAESLGQDGMVHIKMLDRLAQETVIPNRAILAALVEEFNRVGQELDSAGISLTGHVELLEARVQQAIGGLQAPAANQ